MRYLIFATAAAVIFSGSVRAGEPATKIAMGPVSAPHLPSGQPQGSNPSPDCTLPYGQCPEDHKRPRHRHTKPEHPYHDHFRD
jgi:hypothetical protein